MNETTKRCWVIVEGWERTGPLLGVRDTYEAAVLEAANRYVGQRFRVRATVRETGPEGVGGTWLDCGAGTTAVSLWPAELRFLDAHEE